MTEPSIDITRRDLRIPADHPCLPGHFPGQPVVPAVVGLQTVVEVMQAERPGWRLQGIRQAKFMSPLLPEERFEITLTGTLPAIEFLCQCGDRLIARGNLTVEAAAGA